MNQESVLGMARHAIEITVMVGAPMLLVSLIVGLLVAVFQAATSLNEATLSFIPKLLAIFAAMVIAGPWILTVLVDYMRELLINIPSYVA